MVLEHRLPEAIAIPGGTRAMVGGAIVLDPDEVAPRVLRVCDREVDEEARQADLRVHLIAALPLGFMVYKQSERLEAGGL